MIKKTGRNFRVEIIENQVLIFICRIDMYFPLVILALATVVVVVQNHDCKDYDLSASDQSLIDMIKHYLHTSRQEKYPQPGKTSNTGLPFFYLIGLKPYTKPKLKLTIVFLICDGRKSKYVRHQNNKNKDT